MDEEKKHYRNLVILLFILSGLLLIKILPNIIIWNTNSSQLLWDLFGLLWPFIGICTALEFLNKDKWGWGGIIFHIFILYCGIYYIILIIQGILTFSIDMLFIGSYILNIAIAVLGWLTFFYYYD